MSAWSGHQPWSLQMRGRSRSLVLHACTVIFTMSLIGLWWFGPQSASVGFESGDSEDGIERNERSTPRSFILPATPAVALAQQSRLQEPLDEGISLCLEKLDSRGYGSDRASPLTTARNVTAIFNFQRDQGIVASGRLNDDTRTRLGCR
jgi:hypothetical protein